MEDETIENKMVMKQTDEVSNLDNSEIQANLLKVKRSQDKSEWVSSTNEYNETVEFTLNDENDVQRDNTILLNGFKRPQEDVSVESQHDDVRNGNISDEKETPYVKDGVDVRPTKDNVYDCQQDVESTISKPKAVEEQNLETLDADTNTIANYRIPDQDIKVKDENLDVRNNELTASREVDPIAKNRQDAVLDDVQGSADIAKREEYVPDFTKASTEKEAYRIRFDSVSDKVLLDNQETSSEFVPGSKQIVSCLKKEKVLPVKPKVRKSVYIADAVHEDDETELSSIIMETTDSPWAKRALKSVKHNALEAYLSRLAKEMAETDDDHSLCTVRFILDSGRMFAGAFEESCTVKDIKVKLASLFEIDYRIITLKHDDLEVSDRLTLTSMYKDDMKHLDLLLSSRDDTEVVITAEFVSRFIPTVDVITVQCYFGEDVYKNVTVEIENHNLRKEWLGGFQNRSKNVIYHHAATQTLPKERKVFEKSENGALIPLLYERQTQTPFPVKNFAVDTPVDKATQMYRRDYYVSSVGDKIIAPTDFITHEEWLEKNDVIKKVVIIQRAVKHWMKEKTFTKFYKAQRMAVKLFRDEKIKILTEQAERKRKIISGAALPTSRDDFYMLYLMVGRWWKKEWQRIKDIRSDESRKAEYIELLEKEIELLSAIEKQRIAVKGESLRKEKIRFLEVTSRPTVFRNEHGVMTSMDSVETQTARTHKDIYCTLIRTELTSQERTDFLLLLRNQIIQYYNDYEFFYDLIALIEREIDFLAVGTEAKALSGLRRRIELFYLDLVQKPKYNPKARSYRKAKWPKTVDSLYRCIRCQKLMPICDFPIHTRLLRITICTSCEWLQNIGHQRLDMSPYLKLLRQVQKMEMQKCCYTSICFLLQQIGMYFLTRIIWHGHSAISETRNLAKLCMVRWNNREEWTPWNTILLTEQEAEFHASIDDVEQFYSPAFISSVHQKHILARIHFLPLLKTDHALRSTGAWQNITDSGVYIHPTHIKEHFQDEICDIDI